MKSPHPSTSRLTSTTDLIVLALLLILPGLATDRLAQVIDYRLVAGWAAGLPLITYFLYASDKKRATGGQWRISEGTLHLFELLGGWPGAFLAQRRLRHKSAKGSYLVSFWVIVTVHQFVAADWLLRWRMSAGIAGLFHRG